MLKTVSLKPKVAYSRFPPASIQWFAVSLAEPKCSMTMVEPIWEQKRPSASEVEQMWRELRFTFEPTQNEAVDEMLHQLRVTHTNFMLSLACSRPRQLNC